MECRYCLNKKKRKPVTEKKILNNKTLARMKARDIAKKRKK